MQAALFVAAGLLYVQAEVAILVADFPLKHLRKWQQAKKLATKLDQECEILVRTVRICPKGSVILVLAGSDEWQHHCNHAVVEPFQAFVTDLAKEASR